MAEHKPRVVIVHDWLLAKGGAELVVEQLHNIFPKAPIYTSYCAPEWRERLNGRVRTSWLQHLGPIRKFVPMLRIIWFSRLKLNDFDIIISSSGAEAKGVKKSRPDQLHVNYCHAPTHYYWSRYDEYMKNPGFGKLDWLARIGLKILVAPLRKWDLRAAQRPDVIIANSTHIQAEIKKHYGRDSVVIFPPVDVKSLIPKGKVARGGFYVVSGRQTPYKRNDLAIQACSKLDKKLVVIGDGPDIPRLKSLAGANVEFVGRVDDTTKIDYFQHARGLIFGGTDDFGITMVEALAAGCPVIAFDAGGAKDIVDNDKTGILFKLQTVRSLGEAIKRAESTQFDTDRLIDSTERFSISVFHDRIKKIVDLSWRKYTRKP